MKIKNDLETQINRWICYRCIGEMHLSSIVSASGKKRKCSYCGKSRKSIGLEELSDQVQTAFHQYYRRTSDQPDSYQYAMLSDKESGYEWYRAGELTSEAIMNAAEIPNDAACHVQEILSERERQFDIESHRMNEECEFDADAHYELILPDDKVFREEWNQFEKSLKHEARHFNRAGAESLAEIFRGIDKLCTRDGGSLVVASGPGTKLCEIYRARVFQSDERLREALERPDKHMANPPPELATSGRMNAHGVSVFYGATDSETAIAEVRPPVGSKVLVARFTIEKILLLLDLTALDSVFERGSIFDKNWADRLARAAFLKTLSQKMTRPVMPKDEALEYLPTQAIADFLASENEPRLDGILFPSVQTEGKGLNIVIFQRVARVAPLDIPGGVSIDSYTGQMGDDGWEIDYCVTERLRNSDEAHKSAHDDIEGSIEVMWPRNERTRPSFEPAALKVDAENIFVHDVRGVHYECNEHRVTRLRFED